MAAVSDDRGSATWTVTATLTDVLALRRLAVEARSAEAVPMRESLSVAWQHAADPCAPLRSIPGITWRHGPVEGQYLPRRARPSGADATPG